MYAYMLYLLCSCLFVVYVHTYVCTLLLLHKHLTQSNTTLISQLRQEQALNSQLKLQKFEERERTQKALEEDELALKKKQKAKELLLDELVS